MKPVFLSCVLCMAALAISGCSSADEPAPAASKYTLGYLNELKTGISPLDDLPPYITQLTTFGERADFSPDGKRILFLEKTFGDVYEVEIATGKLRPVTHHYPHEGYTRALYLANGDILLSGARQFDAENPLISRNQDHAELWVLGRDLASPPAALGEYCYEGPAVSRKNLRIAWTRNNKFYLADIVYDNGVPRLEGKRMILDADTLSFECRVETQNFRPPGETELIFSAYEYLHGEVMGLDIGTGEVVNYSHGDDQYDEPEGIYPDGNYTLVESDRHFAVDRGYVGIQYDDIHKLALDGSGDYRRITHFSSYEGWKSSNPVVSDDGKYIAFQCARYGDLAGVGRGILLLDIDRFEQLPE